MKDDYWNRVWRLFLSHRLGVIALLVVGVFCLAGIYAPLLASSKPLVIHYDAHWYFPLFRYLFFAGFYTKGVDLFFNVLMFTFPLFAGAFFFGKKRAFLLLLAMQLLLFLYLFLPLPNDPASDPQLVRARQEALVKLRQEKKSPTWDFDLKFMNDYAKLNLLLRYRQRLEQHERLQHFLSGEPTTLHAIERKHEQEREVRLLQQLEIEVPGTPAYALHLAALQYIKERSSWLQSESQKSSWEVMPLLRPFHWEDDAGGDQLTNRQVPWWDLTRINRKDLVAGLIFGIRISLVVGVMAVALAMIIGIPIGALAGYYAGTLDIIVSRLLEIWESMPTFFMLLLVVAMTQSKSIYIVIAVVGIFGWTGFSRYIRGEFLKQRNLPYVEACKALGFHDGRIIFSHVLPNAIPPVLTLLPFAIMGAITSEAGLSFLGLGEEGSCSWGVLMDEGRSAFPAESYLMWPPAILLTLLLIAIALVGDALRDTLDPKMH